MTPPTPPRCFRPTCALLFLIALAAPVARAAGAAAAPDVSAAIAASPIKGGLCVVLGHLDPAAAVELARRQPFLLHVLTPAADLAAPRDTVHAARLGGLIVYETWTRPVLPYMDGLVSLLIVADGAPVVPDAELMRALRPEGELVRRDGPAWTRTTKPRTPGTDDWPQWRHGPDRNPVSNDRVVDVPRRVQWLFSSAVVTEAADMVTARGRIFVQDRDVLLARDAYNGLPLWRVPLYPAKELGLDKHGYKKPPALIVARGERVYALVKDGACRALDAATGKPLLEFKGAGLPTASLLLEDDTLILATDDAVRAYDAATAKLRWEHRARRPRTVMAGGGRIYYIEGTDRDAGGTAESADVFARDAATGDLVWTKAHDWARRSELASYGEGRLLFEVRRPLDWKERWAADPAKEKADRFQLAVLDARTGAEQQRMFGIASSARHGEFCTAFWKDGHLLTEARTPKGFGIARYAPDNLAKPIDVFQANFVGDRGWGHCYPPVLTARFYLNGQLHFTDLESRTQSGNVITRGACHVLRPGYVPANGMIYTFPKHCVCFPMLNGNVCLAPATATRPEESHPLEKGPAFGAVGPAAAAPADTDWPTFRRDEFRTAGTDAPAPTALDVLWSADPPGAPDYTSPRAAEWADNPWVAGPVSAPTIAGGLVFVAQSDAHRVFALDAATGKVRWSFTTPARVDGPPTLHAGLALLGCRDGWVYALRAADGALAWRRRVAPDDRRITVHGQLESAWPVAGSVLVSGDLAYASAGLHPNADGGVRVACLDPMGGDLRWLAKFDDLGMESAWPAPHDPRPTDKPDRASDPWRTIRPQEYRHFDLPVRDGDRIAVSRCTFDPRTGKVELRKTSGYYEVAATGAKIPRTAWRYTDVQSQSPLAAARGNSVYSTSPRKALLFRADFAPGAKFDGDWVDVPHEQFKAGLSHAASKLHASGGLRWAADLAGERASYPRALLVTADAIIYAQPDGALTLRDPATGRELKRAKLEPLAWDGAAATPGRLYVTTASGKVLCLGAK